MAEVLPAPDMATGHLCLVELDERVVVYDRRSGRTHLLDHLTAEVLRLTASDQRLSHSMLGDLLAQRLGISANELPPAVIDDALEQLRTASLVD